MAHSAQDMDSLHTPVVLAVETATLCGSIALTAGEQCLAECSLQSRLTHSRRLLDGLERLLGECGITWERIDAVAVSLGPGSFTGLRIGLSTAKGLVMAAAKPLIGISTLDGLAGQFYHTRLPIYPVLDARKQEVYTACYRCNDAGVPERASNYLVIRPEELCGMVREPSLFAGDGAVAYRELFRDRLAGMMIPAPQSLFFPRAAAIALLAVGKWHEKDFLDPASAVPIYIRPSEAEIHFGK